MSNSLKAISLVILFAFSTTCLIAQSNSNHIGIGFKLSQVQNDFGIGLDLISPYFANSGVALKIGGSYNWLEHLGIAETTWTPYQSIQIGVRSRQFIIENKLFIYGEGGIMILFPNDDFSSKSTEFGGYGLFGFEFKPTNNFGYFFEMGGVGTGATADKVLNKPIYSNGFLTNVGFRINI